MMSRRIPSQASKFRSGFIVVGIALFAIGLVFFYLASRVDYDYVTKYDDVVNLEYSSGDYPYTFGTFWHYPAKPDTITMQPHDYLTTGYGNLQINGTVYIVLWNVSSPTPWHVLKYSNESHLDFKNELSNDVNVTVYLAVENKQNLIPITTILNHYERPQWILLGVGAAATSLALVVLLKSRS